jgi:hypothetical protein
MKNNRQQTYRAARSNRSVPHDCCPEKELLFEIRLRLSFLRNFWVLAHVNFRAGGAAAFGQLFQGGFRGHQPMSEGLSARAAAKELGLTHGALLKATKTGRITRESDKSFIVEKVRRQLAEKYQRASTAQADELGNLHLRSGYQ